MMLFSSLNSRQVTDALTQAGLESSNLIVGIDFTKSNEWTGFLLSECLEIHLSVKAAMHLPCFVSGARSFYRRSLHHIGNEQNPYEQAISIIGKTLSKFDDDNLIPCFGFGDGIFLRKMSSCYSFRFILSITQILCDSIYHHSINT